MKLKILLYVFAIGAITLTACAGGNDGAEGFSEEDRITVTINSSTNTSFAPIYFAYAEGYFEDEGIDLEFVTINRGSDAIPALIAHDLDVFAGGINAGFLNVLGQEQFLKIVADRGHISPEDQCDYQGLVLRKDLYDSGDFTGPEDMAGLAIVSSTSSNTGYFTSLYLAQAGLTFEDVSLVSLPGNSDIEAMANGSVDAVVTQDPTKLRIISDGNGVLFASGKEVYGDFQISILVFGESILVENREAGVRFLKAYLRGVQQYNQGKTDRNIEILVEHTGESEEVLRNSCWVSINADGWIDFEGKVEAFQQWSVEQGHLDAPITEEQFWDPSLLQEALEALE